MYLHAYSCTVASFRKTSALKGVSPFLTSKMILASVILIESCRKREMSPAKTMPRRSCSRSWQHTQIPSPNEIVSLLYLPPTRPKALLGAGTNRRHPRTTSSSTSTPSHPPLTHPTTLASAKREPFACDPLALSPAPSTPSVRKVAEVLVGVSASDQRGDRRASRKEGYVAPGGLCSISFWRHGDRAARGEVFSVGRGGENARIVLVDMLRKNM
jgi:hypothetical protein